MSRPSLSHDDGPTQQSKPGNALYIRVPPPDVRVAARGARYIPPEHNLSTLTDAHAQHMPHYSAMSAMNDEGAFKPAAYQSLPGLHRSLPPR